MSLEPKSEFSFCGGPVNFFDLSVGEDFIETLLRVGRFGEDQEALSGDIKAMRGVELLAKLFFELKFCVFNEVVDRRMHGKARGLIDHGEVVVVEDQKIAKILRNRKALATRVQANDLARVQFGVVACSHAVNVNAAEFEPVGQIDGGDFQFGPRDLS